MSFKNKIKGWLPSQEKLKNDKYLRFLGDLLHDPNIWHVNRASVSGACAIGFACAWMPIPLQMLASALLAIAFRKNLPLATVATWITNPITVPPMFYAAYWLGSHLLGLDSIAQNDLNFDLTRLFTEYAQPLLLGCVVFAVISSAIGYFGMQLLWRYHVIRKLKERRQRHKDKGI